MAFDYSKLYFPYDSVRQYQDLLIQNINASIESRKNLLAHAPTGLGKTVASLAPAIYQAINNDLNVFFLTPRHTQHRLVIDTLREIKDKHGINVPVLDLIGKQHMCPLPVSKELGHSDFTDYCKDMRDNGKCPYYNGTRKVDLTEKAERVLKELVLKSPMHSEDLCAACVDNKLCPYEMALELGKKAKVVVCDYFHLFSDRVRKSFMARMNKDLEDSVLIVDEAHNLPDRVRSLMSFKLSTFGLNASIKELTTYAFEKEADTVRMLLRVLEGLVSRYEREGLVSKNDLVGELESLTSLSYDDILESLMTAGATVREERQKSFTLGIARFLDAWGNDDDDMVRVISRDSKRIVLSYHCLNPAKYTEPVFTEAHSAIMMSGTLAPTSMYESVLGVPESNIVELKSPFPEENRLTLIVPETTTRYTHRSDEEFERIAVKLESVINSANVSTAVFFPSYALLARVREKLKLWGRNVVVEQSGLSKEEKNSLLYNFRSNKGSVLLGVVSGNFGEGVDLPGQELECIIIVGVPLPVPDLYTKSLIDYYNDKFGKGWDYAYVYPALTRVIQSAGRCIRQASDKGLIILLDERYAWKNYLKCIPPEWRLKITKEPERLAKEFFN